MKKIEFKNLPSKETPISANNLNLLQQNVEDEFNTLNSYFEIPQGTNKIRFVKIAEFETYIAMGTNALQLKIYGTTKYGVNKPGFDIVEASTRGGMRISVLAFNHTSNEENQKYGYVNRTDGITELWIRQNTFAYKARVEVANVINCKVGLLKIQDTNPVGIVMFEKEVVATEKSVLSVYNKDNQQIVAKDPSGRKIVFNSIKKDIGGIANLQADGSLKFKKNCTVAISYNLFVDCVSGYVRAYIYTYRGTQLTTLSDTLFNATSSFKALNVAGVIHDFQKDDTLFIDISQSEGNLLTVRGGYANNNFTLLEI